jgi:hypothetical protein
LITGWNAVRARALNPSFSKEMIVIRPWQPAFPQAMQRHGGQTRPADKRVAKAGAIEAGVAPARENADDDNRSDAKVGTKPDKSNESND